MGLGRLRNRVILPELDADGELVYWQARDYIGREPRYLGPKGSRDYHVWNLEQVKGNYSTVIICEGVLSAIACGHNAVATYSYAFLLSQVALLVEAGFEKYIIAFDGHPKAWSQAHKLACSLVERGIREEQVDMAVFPEGSDPADLGPDVHSFLLDARSWTPGMTLV
jgi:DNA primase